MSYAGCAYLQRWRRWRAGPDLPMPYDADDAEVAARRLLLYGELPLWFVPSVADWYMHRRSHIEDTSGVREQCSRPVDQPGWDAEGVPSRMIL